jgi:long-chain acyl-CoA synthetase
MRQGQLGVHPAGALGVAMFVHAQAECFIGCAGDGITESLRQQGVLRLEENGEVRSLPLAGRLYCNLLEADAHNATPEVLLVCCNPSQVRLLTADLTRFIASHAERGQLCSSDDIAVRVPILLILPNGILADEVIQTYRRQLSEAALMDRLPGITPELVEVLLGRVVRGVSMQAGGRRGGGPEAVYIVEARGSILFAGGSEHAAARLGQVMQAHGYTARHIAGAPATRIEFDKAMISIVLNVGGLIHMVSPDGQLIDLRMGDLCLDESKAAFVDRVTRAVFGVGQAIGAYGQSDTYDQVWAVHRGIILAHARHVTSSVKAFRDALSAGSTSISLMPNEEWILTPLERYALRAGMNDEVELFRMLGRQVQESMARAIKRQASCGGWQGSTGNGTPNGRQHMKLTAQRNISIELFEAGPAPCEDLVLIGTMLDNEHLIKLELTIHLPDEQITRSRLDMIRAPFQVCRQVEAVAQDLVGLRIQRGVLNEIARRVGGRIGCSHIKEIATNIVYFAASYMARRRAGLDVVGVDSMHIPPEQKFRLTRNFLRDTCLAYCQTTPLELDERMGIRRLGEEHTCSIALGAFEPSLGAVLRDRAARFGDKPYLRARSAAGTADTLSFNDFAHHVSQMARHLIEQGIRPGDRIAMLSENRPEMYICEMAAMSIGAVSVPIFAGYPSPQVGYVLRHARPRYLIVSGRHQLAKVDAARNPWLERTYCMDLDLEAAAWGALDLAGLLTDGGAPPGRLATRLEAVKPTDLALIMYTSGTTGPPKGVRLLHRNLVSQQKALSQVWDVGPQDVFLSYLPWHHSFGGLFERFMTLYNGCELCLDDSRGKDINRLLENWRLFRPTLFFSVPRIHGQLIARAAEDPVISERLFDGRLRFVFTAAAPLPAHVEAAYREHGIPVLEGWGLTETSPCVTVRTSEHPWRSGFVGFPIPGVSIRIGSDQEILVKGPNVMEGYLDDEEATAHVIGADGWFRTGDLGEFTREGLRILGRKDGAFKLTTGEMVHPQRVENVLVNESLYIGTAVVVGSGRDFVGALIFPDMSRLRGWAQARGIPEAALADDPPHPALLELFASELERINPLIEPKYARIRRAVLADREPSMDRGELTPSAKVVRKVVLDAFRPRLEALFDPACIEGIIEISSVEEQLQKAAT